MHARLGRPGTPPLGLQKAWFYRMAWKELGMSKVETDRADYGALMALLSTLLLSDSESQKKNG